MLRTTFLVFLGLSLIYACKKDPIEPAVIVNKAPIIQIDARANACVDSVFQFEVKTTDPNGDVVTITVEGLPTWASFDAPTATIKGKPSKTDVDSVVVTIVATDGKLDATAKFSIVTRSKSDFQVRLIQKLKAAWLQLMPNQRGISIAVATPDLGILTATEGKVSPWNGAAPLAPKDRFRVASVSKSITAALVLRMVEQGLVKLDDKMTDHLNAATFPNADKITIKQLLSHTAGVFDHFNSDAFWNSPLNTAYKVWTTDEILQFAIDNGPVFTPGTAYSYSNTGIYILGAIAQVKYQKPLRLILDEQIFGPLGLQNIYFDDSSSPSNKIPDMAENYTTYAYHLSSVGAAGAVVATPSDIAAFGRAVYGGRLLNADLTAQMSINIGATVGGDDYGLGTRLWNILDVPHHGHTGNIMGYRSILMYIPESDVAIAMSIHEAHDNWYPLVDQIFEYVVKEY